MWSAKKMMSPGDVSPPLWHDIIRLLLLVPCRKDELSTGRSFQRSASQAALTETPERSHLPKSILDLVLELLVVLIRSRA